VQNDIGQWTHWYAHLQNQILLLKNQDRIVKTISLRGASIRRKLNFKFQNIEQVGAHAVRHGPGDVTRAEFHDMLELDIYVKSGSVKSAYQWKSPFPS